MISFLTGLLFPPICLHCSERSKTLFCTGCAAYFELIDPSTRCRFCFAENEGRRACPECVRKRRWHVPIASALDYLEPIQSVVSKLKYGRMPYLAKTAAAFMLLQFEKLGWERPDVVVPVQSRLWFQGTNHATLLARAFARPMGLPVSTAVGRRVGDLAQARLSEGQRERLLSETFYLKRREAVEGRVVLLIDDVMTTGTTLRQTAEILKEGFPKRVYALTFARIV